MYRFDALSKDAHVQKKKRLNLEPLPIIEFRMSDLVRTLTGGNAFDSLAKSPR